MFKLDASSSVIYNLYGPDWSVETLGLDYNPTGLCNHLFKPE
jgi:hypothetical protein